MKYTKETGAKIANYIRHGETQKAAAQMAGVCEDTFYEWIKKRSEFAEAVKKALADFEATKIHDTKASLYKKAFGYEVTEKETSYAVDADGTKTIRSIKERTKHIPPDTAAIIFILINRLPDDWKNRQNISGEVDLSGLTDSQINEVVTKITESIND